MSIAIPVPMPAAPAPLPPCDCNSYCGDDPKVHDGRAALCPNAQKQEETYRNARDAVQIAERAVVCDVESEGHRVRRGPVTWWDVRPMLDRREVCDEMVDMNIQAIEWGLRTGLLVRHVAEPHLVRVARQPK